MNSSIYRFTLDLHCTQSQISIPALIGDTGRKLRITFSDGGTPYIMLDGCLAKLSITRPTGTHLEAFCAIEDNTTVVYDFEQNQNTAAVEGVHHCDITLYGLDGNRIASPRFTLVVSERVLDSDEIVLVDEDFTAIEAIIAAEASRQNAEAQRVIAEEARDEAEILREEKEAERFSLETQRKRDENARKQQEISRNKSENERIIAENKRVAAESERARNELIRDAKIHNLTVASEEATAKSTEALEKASLSTESVASFREEIGTETLTTGQKTVKSSVNYAVSTANVAKSQSDLVRTNLINLSAQVQGIGRSYVVPDFAYFIDFLNSVKSVELKEDRNGDGVAETYNVSVADLKTGDNIIIVEKGVPDFWFEKNSALEVFDTYVYNSNEYTLSATSEGTSIGGAHILETDYTVIEGLSISAAASAAQALEASQRAEEAVAEAGNVVKESMISGEGWTPEEKSAALDNLGAVPRNDSTGATRIYGVNRKGEQVLLFAGDTDFAFHAGRVAMYASDANGKSEPNAALVTKPPVNDYQCANKKYVDDGFVPKITSAGSAVYAHSGEIQKHISIGYGASPYTIAYRDDKGNFKVSTPVNEEDCANKKYVDDVKNGAETWTFTLEDDTVITKKVVLA